MTKPFVDTKIVAKCGTSIRVYLNRIWGFTPGDLVDIEITKVDDPQAHAFATRKVSKDKSCAVVYLDKNWGFVPGDRVQIKVTPRNRVDCGVGDKESD